MKRGGFARQPRPRKEREPGEFASFTTKPRPIVMAAALHLAMPAAVEPKTPDRKSQAIRDSANGEECLIRIPGCPSRRDMTIWSHNRHQRAGKGGRIKAIDLNGCYGCTWCDAIYDGNAAPPAGMTREQVELHWYHGHAESLVKLRQKGLA